MKYSVDKFMASPMVTVKFDDLLEKAYDKLSQNRIRHLPVVDDFGSIVGIISDRDFQRAMLRDKYDNNLTTITEFPSSAKVGSFMSWPVKTVDARDSLADVCDIMVNQKISALLVSEESRLVGIITHEDLLRVLSKILTEQKGGISQKVEQWAYNSPIGKVANLLSEAGI